MWVAFPRLVRPAQLTDGLHNRGVFDDEEDDSDIEAEFEKTHKAGGYFAHHARKQLAFDIWWIALALWAICIVERTNIDDPATDSYFNVFTILFELISAYGTVVSAWNQ